MRGKKLWATIVPILLNMPLVTPPWCEPQPPADKLGCDGGHWMEMPVEEFIDCVAEPSSGSLPSVREAQLPAPVEGPASSGR
jgi:hypothetical protein